MFYKRISTLILLSSVLVLWTCTKEIDLAEPQVETEQLSEDSFKKGKNNGKKKGKKKGKKNIKSIYGTIIYTPVATPSWCTCAPGTLQGPLFMGSGNLTHLGMASSEVTSCVVPNQNLTVLSVVSSCVTLVAANGDEIYLDQKPYDLTLNMTTFSYEGVSSGKVIGGSGKYKHAKGKITALVSQDSLNVVTSVLTGLIKY